MASDRHESYSGLRAYFGDIHNHCAVSYGHGPLATAFRNAQLQLDFASVTVHGAWPDLPAGEPELDYLVAYHEEGFAHAEQQWAEYLRQTELANQDGRFVTFPSFEWHSCAYGDHCIYFKGPGDHRILAAPDLQSLRETLRHADVPVIVIPHHIGYKQGSRGINWDAFSPEMSPVVETYSFHGLSESSEGPYPYLHSMGPRHELSTAQYGWARGNVFGVVGSTDHHNAFPGSYGYGRMAVWAPALTRESIWDAIQKRRTYALTGDRIVLRYALNDHLMGDLTPAAAERWIDIDVAAGDSIDAIEILHNNRVVHRESIFPVLRESGRFKVYVEMGWGERNDATLWNVELEVVQGKLKDVEPRLRGFGPTAEPDDDADFDTTVLSQPTPQTLNLRTQTLPNLSLHTPATEGFALELEGDAETILAVCFNGQRQTIRLSELWSGSRTFYIGGFVSPAICFHRAIPHDEYAHRFTFLHHGSGQERDWYYVRVRQRNNQWAWSSPIWVGENAKA